MPPAVFKIQIRQPRNAEIPKKNKGQTHFRPIANSAVFCPFLPVPVVRTPASRSSDRASLGAKLALPTTSHLATSHPASAAPSKRRRSSPSV